MSFYLRKSLKAGPFRLNLSKSGIGISTGVKGFRVGTGPRGNYVHMGRHGLSYRTTLAPKAKRGLAHSDAASPIGGPGGTVPAFDPDPVVLEDKTGATPLEMASSSASDFLAQLNAAAKRRPLWPFVLVVGLLLFSLLPESYPGAAIVVLALAAIATWWTFQRDKSRRTVVAFYDVNDEAAEHFEHLVDAFAAVQACQAGWHVLAEGKVRTTTQYKRNAGASGLVRRERIRRTIDGPKRLSTNIAVPSIVSSSRSLFFLPDRILVGQGRSFAEALYSDCRVTPGQVRFIEDGARPSDSELVGTTWKYVNVKGGPDKRYKDNRQLPILVYGSITLEGKNGLAVVWQLSKVPPAASLAEAISDMVPSAV